MIAHYIVSTFVLILLGLGLWQRRHRQRHMILMMSAFVIDVALVLSIELQRHAVERVVALDLSPFTAFHVAISVIVLVLYIVMAVLGRKIVLNKPKAQLTHGAVAPWFIGFRLINYVTSFWVS